MTADLVNLRRERKRRMRDVAGETAAANRLAHGLSGAEKRLAQASRAMAARRLDGHRLADEPEVDAPPTRE